MIEIKPRKIKNSIVKAPASKSYTHRIIIAAALSDGICTIHNALKCEDTLMTIFALQKMGIDIIFENREIVVHGGKGKIFKYNKPIYLKNSGTSIRLLTAVATLGEGKYLLEGTKRLNERPLNDLIETLNKIGGRLSSVNRDGCSPVEIIAGSLSGGKTTIKCGESSQYLSALLLIAPYLEKGIDITVVNGDIVSKPYIDITIDVMKKFGVNVERYGYKKFMVKNGEIYKSGAYTVETDYSNAGYFWGAAAITGAEITVKDTYENSIQGDVKFVEVLEKMGCEIRYKNDGISVKGNGLKGISIDMSDMPDAVPMLGVVAAFAKGETVIKNIAHLKAKESDRIRAVVSGLNKMGIKASYENEAMIIEGGTPKGALIKTYDDHRIAMSFAAAGLKTPGIFIENESCVEKSFPNFWDALKSL